MKVGEKTGKPPELMILTYPHVLDDLPKKIDLWPCPSLAVARSEISVTQPKPVYQCGGFKYFPKDQLGPSNGRVNEPV